MEDLLYRQHRSGLNVRYTPNRGDRLIGYSYAQREQMQIAGDEAGFDVGQIDDMLTLWKLYNREKIVNRLNVVCPGHAFGKTSLKIPMLILWIQHEDIGENQEILRKIRSYSDKRLDHVPTKKIRQKNRNRNAAHRQSVFTLICYSNDILLIQKSEQIEPDWQVFGL